MVATMKVLCVLVACIVASMVMAANNDQRRPTTFTCHEVALCFYPCVRYMFRNGTQGMPPPECCNGLKKLVVLAKDQFDRELACGCMKGFYFTSPNVTTEHSAAVEAKCGVKIAYFPPNYNCSQVK